MRIHKIVLLAACLSTSVRAQSSLGPVSPGTAAANSSLSGCVYNSSPPSLANTNQVAAQCDIHGNMIVSGTGWTLGPIAVTPTDRGSTVSTGGTAVSISANSLRKGGWVRNPANATEPLFISITGTATTAPGSPNQADLPPGATFYFNANGLVYQGIVSINASTSGHVLEAVETQ